MFPVLVKELEQAEHYIYIEYFIINDGVMWRTILDILEQKVAQGVDVCSLPMTDLAGLNQRCPTNTINSCGKRNPVQSI